MTTDKTPATLAVDVLAALDALWLGGLTPAEFIEVRSAIVDLLSTEHFDTSDGSVLMQALLDPKNQPSQFGTVPVEYLERSESLIDGLLLQFKKTGCSCTCPDAECCGFARAETYMAARVKGESA
jgi:hypothetical protein